MSTFWKFIGDTEVELDKIFGKQAPALPQSGREVIAMILPWLAVIACIFLIPTILLALGLSALLAPFALVFNPFNTSSSFFSLFISAVFSVLNIVLLCLAIPGLFKRTKMGWNYLYLSQLIGVVQNLLTLSIVSLIVSFVIGMYLLFQVRPLYLGQKHVDGPTPPPSTPVPPSGM